MDDKKNEAEAGRGSMSQRIKQPGVGVSPPKFGGEILRARKDAGLSLDELARRSGVSKSILSQIERRSEEHTSELQSLMRISYAVFCLIKKKDDASHIRVTHMITADIHKQ